jgi:hypothetical protein
VVRSATLCFFRLKVNYASHNGCPAHPLRKLRPPAVLDIAEPLIRGYVPPWGTVLCSLRAPSDGNVVERHLIAVRKKPAKTPRAVAFPAAGWRAVARAAALTSVLLVAGMLSNPSVAFAEAPVGLGVAGTYSVLAGTMVTSTGATTISGDLGVSPGGVRLFV